MNNKFEVIEKSTGARMSYQRGKSGDIMGTTLFDSEDAAKDWMKENGLLKTHKIESAK